MIGVCIKYFHENYGGMLQAYATISMLEARGVEYELIQYQKENSLIGMIKSLPRLLNSVLLNDKYELFLKKRGKKSIQSLQGTMQLGRKLLKNLKKKNL
ncbi:hypothetical protein HNP82_001287 [Catenibacillus scindens]|uniref:Uncharacterized protein n=1 Tax=Catenibacillus scindens TaxID=673271 RepID=A0A7W8M5B3_9FIRM|nr:hypothetical protein [Catenibacillus scindens]MBB5264176.1 hypothetical protein [Catenibacillus scindens]